MYQTVISALSFIGVDPNDFDLKNSYFEVPITTSGRHRIHGIGHIYRVMIGTALIAKTINEPRIGFMAFCAAFIHDLARKDDGGDFNHGLRAAQKSFNQFAHIWKKYQLSNYERDYVRAAAANHADHYEHNYLSCREVDEIICDADALDRCRFSNHARLDPSKLRLPVSHRLIHIIEHLCTQTQNWVDDISFVDFIEKATRNGACDIDSFTYNREYAPDPILAPIAANQVFVYNQKLSGGTSYKSAEYAVKRFGASLSKGVGYSGQAYTIPINFRNEIEAHISNFIEFAKNNPQLEFLVTKIGRGNAGGLTVEEVAPMFRDAFQVENILLPKEFVDFIVRYN